MSQYFPEVDQRMERESTPEFPDDGPKH